MSMKIRKLLLVALSVAFFTSCQNGKTTVANLDEEVYKPRYATGFAITSADNAKSAMITVYNPWQGADSVNAQLYVERDNEGVPEGYHGQVLHGDAKRVVAMSSTHVAMLEAIGAIDCVVGVSGIDFISNETIQKHRDEIGDVGYDGNINYEVLLSLSPDLVLAYGVNGASAMEGKLEEFGIPYMYVGDYLEESPLGKAEWMVALAEVVGKYDAGVEAFKKIPLRYNKIKERAAKYGADRPKVMINTPYGDSWFMPSTKSYISQLISDAGGEYIYKKNNGTTSTPIDMEEAYLLALNADRWINVGMMTSLSEMRNSYPKFAETKSVKYGEVYNSNKRTSTKGANDYWESGVVYPDLVLRDMLKIMHPEAVNEEFVYYQQLK